MGKTLKILALLIILITNAYAQDPQTRCQSSKNVTAGIYTRCRLGDDSTKSCKTEFKRKWIRISKRAESKGVQCLDASLKYSFYVRIIKSHTRNVLSLLGGKEKNLDRPVRRCRNLKTLAAGLYSLCRYRAEALFAKTKNLQNYNDKKLRCEERFASRWQNVITLTENQGTDCFDSNKPFSDYKDLIDVTITEVSNHIAGIVKSPTPVATSTPFIPSATPTASATPTVTHTPTPGTALISVTGSPLQLETNGPVGNLTITNLSASVSATNITSSFTSTALDGLVTETANTCNNIAPGASCTLSFTPGNTAVAQTNFSIQGSNTNTLTAAIEIVQAANITSLSVTSGTASGGTGITITGTGLTGATSVTFGGIAATSVNVVNSTTITAVTPAHAIGAVDVVVTTPSDTGTLTNGYTYVTTAVGQSSGGGIIACLNGGLSDLIAATADNSVGIEYGGFGITTNANSASDGASNSAIIIATLGAGTYAASICNDYEVDSQGNTPCQAGNACYNDWFLPAQNQLDCTYTNRVTIGGYVNNFYWSSTEQAAGAGIAQSFLTGAQGGSNKSNVLNVRCVRSFVP